MSALVIPYVIYQVTIQILGNIEGGVPKDSNVMKTWLETKGISSADTYQETVNSMNGDASTNLTEIQDETMSKNWCGFKKGELGLYIEARQIKAAFKEAANVLKDLIKIKNARARLAEKIWVKGEKDPEKIWLNVQEASGSIERVVHAMTRSGPISGIKKTDYVKNPVISFRIKVLDDGTFTFEVIEALLLYMGENGLGANRSQGAGVFESFTIKKIEE